MWDDAQCHVFAVALVAQYPQFPAFLRTNTFSHLFILSLFSIQRRYFRGKFIVCAKQGSVQLTGQFSLWITRAGSLKVNVLYNNNHTTFIL